MDEEKRISDLMKKIDKVGGSLKKQLVSELIGRLRKALKDQSVSSGLKSEYRDKLVELIRERGLAKLDSGEPAEYHIVYDTLGHGLEPVYFWTLDFMRDDDPSGLGLEVDKIAEEFEASVGGAYFGEMGTRASVMQDRAMAILERVNNVLRIVLNLIYDLKEFEIRLKAYDDLKSENKDVREAAEMNLKAVWMDQVDIKRGRASINMLSQDLQFVTLRDAFMHVKSESGISKMDLNDRVKRILKHKINEYLHWKEYSEKELRKRYEVERTYLRAQVASLRLYSKWAKPYLIAAQKLGMKGFKTKAGLPSPDMVTTFSNMQMQLTLLGKEKISPASVYKQYAKMKFKHDYYSCLEVEFKFRTVPRSIRTEQGSHYLHSGTIDVFFRAFVFTKEDLDDLEKYEAIRDLDLVENLTDVSLKELQDDLDRFLEPPREEEKKKKKVEWPFGNMFKGLKENVSEPFKEVFKGLKGSVVPEREGYALKKIKEAAEENAVGICLTAYDVFKKSHGMTTW